MIRNATDAIAIAAKVSSNRRKVGVEPRSNFGVETSLSIPGRKYDMNQGECVGFRHAKSIDRAVGPCLARTTSTWGVAPGWYGLGPLALRMLATSADKSGRPQELSNPAPYGSQQ